MAPPHHYMAPPLVSFSLVSLSPSITPILSSPCIVLHPLDGASSTVEDIDPTRNISAQKIPTLLDAVPNPKSLVLQFLIGSSLSQLKPTCKNGGLSSEEVILPNLNGGAYDVYMDQSEFSRLVASVFLLHSSPSSVNVE
ncbi:hypothetical protein LguiA_027540 [Lonicera macranthoides]